MNVTLTAVTKFLFNWLVELTLSSLFPKESFRGWVISQNQILCCPSYILSFALFVTAVKCRTHGELIQHANFDSSLWSEMIPKILLDYPDMPKLRPAMNWGCQYKTLVVMAPGDKSKLMREHLEVVYPNMIYNGWGIRTENPVHVVVPEVRLNLWIFYVSLVFQLMGNISCRIQTSEDSGFIGLLQRFLPTFTSSDPQCRDQQVYGLCAFIGIHHYRFIVDYLGGCPGLTFISTDPGVNKF